MAVVYVTGSNFVWNFFDRAVDMEGRSAEHSARG
jgi:hypothetical protein